MENILLLAFTEQAPMTQLLEVVQAHQRITDPQRVVDLFVRALADSIPERGEGSAAADGSLAASRDRPAYGQKLQRDSPPCSIQPRIIFGVVKPLAQRPR